MDALFAKRSDDGPSHSSQSVISQLLKEVEDKPDNVFLLCSTNKPWNIDAAFQRRFNKMIYVPLPNMAERALMFKANLDIHSNFIGPRDYHFLAQITSGYSGCDIANLCNNAKSQAFERAVLSTHFIFDPIVDAYWACMPSEGGIKNSVEVLQDKVNVPPITMKDMERATWDAKKTGGDEYHSRFEAFASEFGSNVRPTED